MGHLCCQIPYDEYSKLELVWDIRVTEASSRCWGGGHDPMIGLGTSVGVGQSKRPMSPTKSSMVSPKTGSVLIGATISKHQDLCKNKSTRCLEGLFVLGQ